jgi:hypothetical protein
VKSENTGQRLNKEWGIRAKHALYSRDGTWYERLNKFPGALLDAKGYVLFNTETDFLNCPVLTIRKKVTVARPGISQLAEYVAAPATTIRTALSSIDEDEVDEYFNPKDDRDARERIAASIARRRGQPKFRRALLKAYDGKCAITGCDVKETLEAAHIVPYKGAHTNKVANGLLLRADVHTLFDLGLIAIDTQTMTVFLAPALVNTVYKEFKGTKLRAKPEVMQKIKAALDEHHDKHFPDSKSEK